MIKKYLFIIIILIVSWSITSIIVDKIIYELYQPHYGDNSYNICEEVGRRTDLSNFWQSVISIAFLVPIVFLIIRIIKIVKRKSENIKKRLLRVCSPKAFLLPYNKEIVDKANYIYPKIEHATSEDELLSLADEAQNLLGISVVESFEIESLKKEVKPSNFLKPYDAEKIALANELYSILQNDKILYSEYRRIVEQAKELKK